MTSILQGAALLDPALAGGKAAALAQLAGIAPVPPFVVLPPDAFADGALRPAAAAALEVALPPADLYAVRSSGAGEDGAALAHAGQFLSLLGVPRGEVAAAAARVHASGAGAAAYRAAHGAAGGVAMSVIVQRQLRPSAAGAAFTADPAAGRRDRILVAAVPGLADALLGGEADGDEYALDRAGTLQFQRLAGAAPVLDAPALAAVAALALACEAACGTPQDVEWAIEGGTLFLLQSRPVTTPGALPDDAVTIWDNSNIVESYPGVTSPLTFSFARHTYAHVYRALLLLLGVPAAAVAAHRPVLDNLLGRIEGRVYYNLLNWYRTLALLPGFALNRRAMEEMMGVGAPLPAAVADRLAPPRPMGTARLAAQARLGLVGLRLAAEALRLPRRVARFNTRLAAALAPPSPPLHARPLTALAAEYRALEARLLERWDAPLVNDLVCMVAFSASRRAMGAWAGDAGLARHAEVLVGQGSIVSAEPAQRIRAMGRLASPAAAAAMAEGRAPPGDPALEAEVAAYLARFGDRCAEELKLESTPLTADPAPLYRAIAAAAAAPARTAPAPAHQPDLFPGRPLRRVAAGWLLAWAKARVRDRENLRLARTRVFGRVRAIVRAMGAQLAAAGALARPDDVFLLTVEELLGAIEGGGATSDLRGLADLRRREQARAAAGELPDRVQHAGAAVLGLRGVAPAAPPTGDGDRTRTGLGCAPGLVRGTARVVRDARQGRVGPGEVLVARHTDPGWIALFANAGAIVVERGSLLSHSAIVARELGIPCVVQLKGATDWITDGEAVEVDGATGRVSRDG